MFQHLERLSCLDIDSYIAHMSRYCDVVSCKRAHNIT